MDTSALPKANMSRPKKERKHDVRSWGYPEDDEGKVIRFAVGCSCGFNQAGIPTQEEADQLAADHQVGRKNAKETEILMTSKGDEVEVKMTDSQAAEVLSKLEHNGFARSLVDSFARFQWSVKQRAWAHKLANDHVEGKDKQTPKVLESKKLIKIVELFQKAATKLKYPKVKLDSLGDGQTPVRLGMAGSRAQYPGSINITLDDGVGMGRTWYGRIHTDGTPQYASSAPRWVKDLMEEFNIDPVEYAKLYGTKFGNCCFCGLELTDERSTSAGYGPVCAGNYGLPWG